jgi:hypothetical protein
MQAERDCTMVAAPGSATNSRTQDFDAPVFGDLDDDGDDDAASWLVQQPGGSGTYATVFVTIAGHQVVAPTEG